MPANLQNNLVDLRSDTVTRPSEEMYEAMRNAPLGDDVLGDDPSVIQLEQLAATKVGMQAALFVPSGTMGNQIALACHCNRGDAIVIEEEAHILYYEVGASAVLAGVVSWTLPSASGAMAPEDVRKRILKANLHTPGTRLICLENTHNRAGGTIIPQENMAAYRQIANESGVKIHLDGARVFNASVAQAIDVREITRHVDSVSICLSKGLGSPVGSLLCGSSDLIDKARIWRKRLGGGMRQAGLLAACGIVSLTRMVDRLAEDHARAKRFAQKIQGASGISCDQDRVITNMVMVDTSSPAAEVMAFLAGQGVLCLPTGPNRLRFVFHVDVDDEKTDRAIEALNLIKT
jgi:threonine aldolase